MLKMFLVELEDGGYDTYDSCVIVAESEEFVVDVVENGNDVTEYGYWVGNKCKGQPF